MKQPKFYAVIPFLDSTVDLFNKVLRSQNFTAALLTEALGKEEKFERLSKSISMSSYRTPDNEFVDIWVEPGSQSSADGITVFTKVTQDGLIPHRLCVGANVPGFMFLYSMSCCGDKTDVVSAALYYPTSGGAMAAAHKAGAGVKTGMGEMFKGKIDLVDAKSIPVLDHIWAHALNRQHSCAGQPRFDVFKLPGGPRQP